MTAVVDIAGFQYEVENNSKLVVPLLSGNPGDSVEFNNILLAEEGGNITIGSPFIEGGKIQAKIIDHGRDEKILVFHKKRRKGYRKLNGHRQKYSKIEITDIKV